MQSGKFKDRIDVRLDLLDEELDFAPWQVKKADSLLVDGNFLSPHLRPKKMKKAKAKKKKETKDMILSNSDGEEDIVTSVKRKEESGTSSESETQ